MTLERIWILAEQRDGRPREVTLELLAAARRFARLVDGFSWGAGVSALATPLGARGMGRLFDVGSLDRALAGPSVAAAIAASIEREGAPDAILLPSTCDGRDIAARLSVAIDQPVLANVIGLTAHGGALESEHAIFGGAEVAHARITSEAPAIFVIRPKSFQPEEGDGELAQVIPLDRADLGDSNRAEIITRHVDERSGPSLSDAAVIVAGGIGLGVQSNFELVVRLAGLLHGAAAASRAIVDAGWVPYAYQVGQTGKTVKPDVYLACGISGATQHLVGMRGARHIIAINTDPSAAIFRSADLGIVGDATKLLPRLIDAIERRA